MKQKSRDLSISQKIFKNSLFSELKIVIIVVINLLIIPYVMKKIGIVSFGAWSIFIALMGIIGLFDLGLNTNLTRLTTKYFEENNHKEINILVNTSLFFFVIIGMIIFSSLLLGRNTLYNIFFSHSGLIEEQVFTYLSIFSILGIVNLFQMAFNNILVGLQKFSSLAKYNIFSNIVNSFILVILLYYNLGLMGVTIATGVSLLIVIVLEFTLIIKEMSFLKISPSFIKPKNILNYLKYGTQVSLTSIANTLIFQGNKFIITYFFGLSDSGYYDIALRIINQIRVIPSALLETILPISTQIQAKNMLLKLEDSYKEMLRNFVVILFPIFTIIIIYAPVFVKLWLGKEIPQLAISLQLLSLVQVINLLTGPSFLIQTGLGKPIYGAISASLNIIINFTLFPLFCWKWGYQGGLESLLISFSVATLLYLYYFHKSERIGVFQTAKVIISPLIVAVVIIPIIYKLLFPLIQNFFTLFLFGLGSTMIYLVIIIGVGLIRKDEVRQYFRSLA